MAIVHTVAKVIVSMHKGRAGGLSWGGARFSRAGNHRTGLASSATVAQSSAVMAMPEPRFDAAE